MFKKKTPRSTTDILSSFQSTVNELRERSALELTTADEKSAQARALLAEATGHDAEGIKAEKAAGKIEALLS